MNDFGLNGIDFIDIPTTIRTQIPSFPDFKLRGFMGGFASKCAFNAMYTTDLHSC